MEALIIGLTIGLATMTYVVYLVTHIDEKGHTHE